MNDPDNRKDYRRQKLNKNHLKKEKVSEEERFLSKAKKAKKQKIDEIREEELWQEWEDYT